MLCGLAWLESHLSSSSTLHTTETELSLLDGICRALESLLTNAVYQTALQPRRILAVFNPAAGRGRRSRFDRVVAALRDLGCAVTVVETTAPGHAEAIARETSERDFDVIAVAGGDGTINEAVNGLKKKNITLGIIPLGTANVVADEIGLRRSPAAIARTLAHGSVKPIYVGLANDRRFVMMAGAGFDANVVSKISLSLKKKVGPLAYVWGAMRQSFADAFTTRAVVIDGASYRTVSVVACNGRRYGGPFMAAPEASLADNTFEVVLMTGGGWFSVARYGLGLLLGRISMWPDVHIIKGREVSVEGVGGPVQADGDIITNLPVRISVDSEPVKLIYPHL